MKNKKNSSQLGIHIHLIDRLAIGNGLISGLALFPQVIKIMTTGNTDGISVITSILIWMNSLIWVIYAVHRGLISVGISSALNLIASTLLLGSLTYFVS